MPIFNTRYGDENLAPAFKPDLGEQEFIDPTENLPSAQSLPAWNNITNLKEWQASDDNKKNRVYQKYLKDISGTKEWQRMEQTDRAVIIKRIWKDAGFYITEPPPQKGFLAATGERMQDVITQVNEAPSKILEAVKSGKPTATPVMESFQAIISPALLALAPIGAAFETAGSGVAREFTSPEKAEQIGKTVGNIAEMATPFLPLKAGKYAEALSLLGIGNLPHPISKAIPLLPEKMVMKESVTPPTDISPQPAYRRAGVVPEKIAMEEYVSPEIKQIPPDIQSIKMEPFEEPKGIEGQPVETELTPIEKAGQHGEVIGIDAKTKLPIIDTSIASKPKAPIDKSIIGRNDLINDITLGDALQRAEGGENVSKHLKEGVDKFGADDMQHAFRNGLLNDMGQMSKGLRKVTEKNIQPIQKSLDKALEGKKLPSEIESSKTSLTDYLKREYPDVTKDEIDIASHRVAEIFGGVGEGATGKVAGAGNSTSEAWRRFANTRQEVGARGGRASLDFGIPEFERHLRDVVNERQAKPQEAWKLSLDEFIKQNEREGLPTDTEIVQPYHKQQVLKAYNEGKTVPAEVLKDYPDLQAQIIEIKNSEKGDLIKSIEEHFGNNNINFRKSPLSLEQVHLKDGRIYNFANQSEWEKGGHNVKAIYKLVKPAEGKPVPESNLTEYGIKEAPLGAKYGNLSLEDRAGLLERNVSEDKGFLSEGKTEADKLRQEEMFKVERNFPQNKLQGKGYSMYAGLPLTDIPAGDIIKGTVAGTKLEDDTSVSYHPEPVNDAIMWLINKWKKQWTEHYDTFIKSSKGELTPEQEKRFIADSSMNLIGMTALPKLGKAITRAREIVEDSNIRIKKMIESGEFKVDEANNIYEKAKVYWGKLRTRLEKSKFEIEDIDKDILATAKKFNVDDTAFTGTLNKYLIAKHTPERVAALGKEATTIPLKDALTYVNSVRASKYGKDITRIADKVLDMNRRTLDILKEGGVISPKTYDLLRNKYKNHVPLKRIIPDAADDVGETLLSPKGLDVRTTGLKRAKGDTELEIKDILTNVFENHANAIMRAEKNIVDNATYKFFIDNKDLLGDTWKLRAPKFIGIRKIKTPEGIKEIPIREFSTDPRVLTFLKDGKRLELFIDDKPLAAAIKGVNKYKLDGFTKFIGSYTRYIASMSTRYALEFPPVNKIRDLQEAIIYLASKKEMGFKGAVKTLGSEVKLKSVRSIKDWMLGKDTGGAKLYQQLLEDGGTTGGLTLSMRKPIEVSLTKIRATDRSIVRQGVKGLLDGLDHWNRIFEDSTRLSAYESALRQGLSRQRAAVIAKEASIDFDKMGTGGPLLNALYVFSNASVQGSAKMLRAFRDNPKVALGATLGVTTGVWNVYDWNDSIAPDWQDKVSKWDLLNGLPVGIPSTSGDFNYIVIPVSWGLKPIKVAAQKARDLYYGKTNKEDAAKDIFVSVVEGYNPLGGTNIWQAITPTIADTPIDIARNKSWSGSRIKPEPMDDFTPESEKYSPYIEKSVTGQAFIGATKEMARHGIEISPADINYAYNQLIGGAGRTASKTINLISSVSKGETPEIRDIPFVSKFFHKGTEEDLKNKMDTVEEERVLTEQARDNEQKKRELKKNYELLKKGGKITKEIDEKYVKKLLRLHEMEQFQKDEKLVKKMGVENGVRARYVLNKIEQIKDREDKKTFLKNLLEKKLITEQVLSQIMILKEMKSERSGRE